MKIERLSENQIRCTLNKADLTEKQLKISELAYGTPKAKELFKDMMQQASVELGFEADDTPLMIEAIPVSPDCLILIVTKVEDPEELDTRFSRFSKTSEYDIDDDDEYMDDDDIDDDLDDNDESRDNNGTIARLEISGSGSVPQGVREALEGIFNTISGLAGTAGDFAAAANGSNTSSDDSTTVTAASTTGSTKESGSARESMCSLYIFDSLATIISAAKQVASFYFSENCLYKNPSNGRYYLVLTNSNNTSQEFVRVCNILAEYGTAQKLTYAMPAHFKEHFTAIMPEEALQTLSAL
jgi:adapter protein MecA 1/2